MIRTFDQIRSDLHRTAHRAAQGRIYLPSWFDHYAVPGDYEVSVVLLGWWHDMARADAWEA